MARIGFALIVAGIIGILFNGYSYLKFRKIKKAIEAEGESLDEAAPFLEYNSSLFWIALACLPAGYYLAFIGAGDWVSLVGLVIGLYGISAFIQSFRSHDTMVAILQAGRDPGSLKSTLIFNRILGLICMAVGTYLFV